MHKERNGKEGNCRQCGRPARGFRCDRCQARMRDTAKRFRERQVSRGLTSSGKVRLRQPHSRTAANPMRVIGDDAEVELSNGMVATIDIADLSLIQGHNWRHLKSTRTFYAQANVPGAKPKQTILMHRLILGLSDPSLEADHRDGNGLNNRRSNLRPATSAQNRHNSRKSRRANTTSQYKGVCYTPYHSASKPWKATFKKTVIGQFATELEAAAAYDAFVREECGEFAGLNLSSAC